MLNDHVDPGFFFPVRLPDLFDLRVIAVEYSTIEFLLGGMAVQESHADNDALEMEHMLRIFRIKFAGGVVHLYHRTVARRAFIQRLADSGETDGRNQKRSQYEELFQAPDSTESRRPCLPYFLLERSESRQFPALENRLQHYVDAIRLPVSIVVRQNIVESLLFLDRLPHLFYLVRLGFFALQ